MPSTPPNPKHSSQTDFGPEVLLIFVGYSSDGTLAADTIVSLEPDLQRELDKLKRVSKSAPYTRIKIWKWESDAAALPGGQAAVITPHLERANMAVFVFNERIGPVAWSELNEARARIPPIPVLPFFPAKPPANDKMMDGAFAERWADLIRKRKELAAGWTDPETNSLTPLPQYLDEQNLSRIAFDRITTEIVRIIGAFADNTSSQRDDEHRQAEQRSASRNEIPLGKEASSTSKPAGTYAPMLSAGNILSVAPAGVGRYSATVVPTLASHAGAALIVDPTGRIYEATATLREKFGPIVKLDPWGLLPPDTRGVSSLDPFDILKALGMSPTDSARMMAELVIPYRTYRYRRRDRMVTDPFWPAMQRKFLVGLFILASQSAPQGSGILSQLRTLLSSDDVVYTLAKKLDESNSAKKDGDTARVLDPECREEINSFLQQPDATRGGILAGVSQHFGAFGSVRAQRATESTSFDIGRWIRGEGVTIYMVGSPAGTSALDSLYSLWLGTLQLPLFQRPTNGNPATLFILDINESFEMWPGLPTAISQLHDCLVWAIVTDLSEIRLAFDEFAEATLNSFSAIQALRPKNLNAATEIAQFLGTTAEKLMEIAQDELWAVIDGAAPVRLTRMDKA